MVQEKVQKVKEGAMDQGAIDGATDDASDGSRSDEWCKRWIRKQ
jgi:hypothetical protein